VDVMIPLLLVLPDHPCDLTTLEETVVAVGQTAMREAFRRGWAAQEEHRSTGTCPVCGGADLRPDGRKPRKLETSFGPVWLSRRRLCCTGCGRHVQPEDAVLAADLGGGRCTARLRDLVALCGASWPYRQVAEALGQVRGAPVSHETVRAVVGDLGAREAKAHAREALTASAVSARRREPERPVPERLEVELDGGWVSCHDAAHGTEVKVGVIHTGSEEVGRNRRRLRERRYVATVRGVEPFGRLVTAAIEHVNGSAAPTQVILGDGAGWIGGLGGDLLPAATPVLDRWHLAEARRRARRAALSDKEAQAPWSQRLDELLEAGDVSGAIAALAEVATIAPHPALTDFAGYLTALAPRIPDDAGRREAGERVGSGGAENGVDLVVNRRLKGKRGMRWRRDRIAAVVALRVTLLNQEWDTRITPSTIPKTPG
jgi:hypothetical protein